jgi:hypothetical protein
VAEFEKQPVCVITADGAVAHVHMIDEYRSEAINKYQ